MSSPRASKRPSRMVTLLSIATACYITSLTSPTSPLLLSAEASPVPATKEQLRWIASQAVQVDQDPLSLIILPRKRSASLTSERATWASAASVGSKAKREDDPSSSSSSQQNTRLKKRSINPLTKRSVAASSSSVSAAGVSNSADPHERRRRNLYSAYEAIVNSDSQMPVFLTHDQIPRRRQRHQPSVPEIIHSKPLRPFVRVAVPSFKDNYPSENSNDDNDEDVLVVDENEDVFDHIFNSHHDHVEDDNDNNNMIVKNSDEDEESTGVQEPEASVEPFLDTLLDKETPSMIITDTDDEVHLIDEDLVKEQQQREEGDEEVTDNDLGSLSANPVDEDDNEMMMTDDADLIHGSIPALSEPEPPREWSKVSEQDIEEADAIDDEYQRLSAHLSDMGSSSSSPSLTSLQQDKETTNNEDGVDANDDGHQAEEALLKASYPDPSSTKEENEELLDTLAPPHHRFAADPLRQDDSMDSNPFGTTSSSAASVATDLSWSDMTFICFFMAVVYFGYRIYAVRRSTNNMLLPYAQTPPAPSVRTKGCMECDIDIDDDNNTNNDKEKARLSTDPRNGSTTTSSSTTIAVTGDGSVGAPIAARNRSFSSSSSSTGAPLLLSSHDE
ncbi:hypothetical protein BGW41_007462 [Actinomortierella wolfii]|nr:hypothetical protein BGW41_007462 [Actinomortierella wolfii]